MNKQIRSYLHVFIQFGIIFYLIFEGPVLATGFLLIIELFGIFLGLWSIWIMRKSYLSIFPEPAQGFNLIDKGPYHIIRHPMYCALFLTFIPLVIESPTRSRIIILAVFISNQLLKLMYEERLIESEIDGYSDYKKRTWRIVPFIF